MSKDPWDVLVELVSVFLKKPARMEHLLERIPTHFKDAQRRRCHSLLYGTVRNISLLEKALGSFLKKRPKPGLWASLLLASQELRDSPEDGPKIVHYTVGRIGERFSKAEKGLANAVLRKMPAKLVELENSELKDSADLAWRYSHPDWLVERWVKQFGFEEALAFLEWNQQEPEIFGRWQGGEEEIGILDATPWKRFYRLEKSKWEELRPRLDEGRFYVQNPGARVAPSLLAEVFEEGRVLDLCAAPGGKSLLLEKLLGSRVEKITSVDLPGPRCERMKGNFKRYRSERISVIESKIEELENHGIGVFAGVFIDVPCSNSGVLQRKIDARWRVSSTGIHDLIELQLSFLNRASQFVDTSGYLVYSTCSVDRSENEGVVERFLDSTPGADFSLVKSVVSLPWKVGHDGSGAFLLKRR